MMSVGHLGVDDCQLNLGRGITGRIEELQRADQMFYNMMTLEIWSLAQTMDEIQPGFWADYMRNRQAIVQQHLAQRRHSEADNSRAVPTASRKSFPFAQETQPPRRKTVLTRVSSFSDDLDRDLPKVTPRSVRPALAQPSIVPVALSSLPHLIRYPVVKAVPTSSRSLDTSDSVFIAIGCWLTQHFSAADSDNSQPASVPEQLEEVVLQPGQSIICHLGFQLTGLHSPVQVQLVKSLRFQRQLVATWVEAEADSQPLSMTSSQPEAGVKLTNHGTQPCTLQAGQAFCRLEFRCPTANLTASLPMSSKDDSPSSAIF